MHAKHDDWTVVCTHCHEKGKARWVTPGDGFVELLLYFVTLPLLCAGGILYTGLRSLHAHWSCPSCTSRDVIPAGSFGGKEILRNRPDVR